MTKNEAWVRIGSSIAAAMLCYLVLNVIADQMTLIWKMVIICTVTFVALAIAFWGGKKNSQKEEGPIGTSIGTDITAKGNVIVEDVKVDTNNSENVKVGSNISTKKDVRIQDVHVGSKGSNNG